jgi:hypothetical protein
MARSAFRCLVAGVGLVALGPLGACEVLFPDDFVAGGSASNDAGSDTRGDAGDNPEAGVNGPSIPCSEATATLCEDFEEDGGLDGNLWDQVETMGGQSVIDTTRPHWGTHSLHSQTNAVPTGGTPPNIDATIKAHLSPLPSPVYARSFLYIKSSPQSAPQAGTAAFFGLLQNSPPYYGINLAMTPSGQLSFSDYSSQSPPFVMNGITIPTDQWVCLEWEATVGSNGATTVWMNGSPALTTSQSLVIPTLDIFIVGAFFYPAAPGQPPLEMWTDDIYVDTQPVGCEK